MKEIECYRQLCRSMVILAIQDCFRDAHYAHNRRLIYKAKEWILDNSECPFSFIWCVENGLDVSITSISTEELIKKIRAIITEENNYEIWRRLLRGSNISKHVVIKSSAGVGSGLLR